MNWIKEPSNKKVVPNTHCGLHICGKRKKDDGTCILRVCLTRYCYINY